MPRNDLTLIVCVLDRSGSMSSSIDDAVGGFNTFLEEQKKSKNGEARMTIALFDHEYELLCENADINVVAPFTKTTWCPRGQTALIDAVGKTINTVGKELDARKEEDKPGKVLFVIVTDGQENASREFTKDQMSKLIKEQREKWNWEFLFLAADENGIADGRAMGIVHTQGYNVHQTKGMYADMSRRVYSYRAGSAL
jgi:Mg-chelatase subunit ChlD